MTTETFEQMTLRVAQTCPNNGYYFDVPKGYFINFAKAIRDELCKEQEPSFRGYAALGTGQYLLNACPATDDLPAELVISIATEAEKIGRVIGDLKDVEPGTVIKPDAMAVRLAFFNVAGLDALEQQLRILREESFPDTFPQPDRTAELEARIAELEKDAARYRFIRDQHQGVEKHKDAEWFDYTRPSPYGFTVFHSPKPNECSLEPVGSIPGELNAAIDKAIASVNEKGGE